MDSEKEVLCAQIKSEKNEHVILHFQTHPKSQSINNGPGWRVLMLPAIKQKFVGTPLERVFSTPCVQQHRAQVVIWRLQSGAVSTDIWSILCTDNVDDMEIDALTRVVPTTRRVKKIWLISTSCEDVNRQQLRNQLIRDETQKAAVTAQHDPHTTLAQRNKRQHDKKQKERRTSRRWTKIILQMYTRSFVDAMHHVLCYHALEELRETTTVVTAGPEARVKDMFTFRGDSVHEILLNRWNAVEQLGVVINASV